mgnify:FL=1
MNQTNSSNASARRVARQIVDMRENSYIDILGSQFGQFSIQMGEENLSNESFIVSEFNLSDPFPNPFNPKTQLDFNIPVSDFLKIEVYDVGGNLINVLHDGFIQSGEHTIYWDAGDLSSGVYIIKSLYQNDFVVKKAILVK